jgi:internalin A
MDLKYLHVAYTAVKDLAPLRGMKLNEFSCGMSGVTDLSPLEGMPLEALSFTPSRIAKGMDAIRGMATLKRIENDGDARAWDVGFLPAEQFWKAYDCAEALRLAAVEYKRLRADETGMCWLDLSGTGLESLEALKDVVGRLAWLDISRTRVKNLEQLRGAKKLTSLNLAGAPVTDLAPLQGLALEDLQFSPNRVTNGVAAVRAMKSLVRLGTGAKDTAPPYEFWQRYDSGEFRRQAD